MKFHLTFNPNQLGKVIVTEQLSRLGIAFTFNIIGHLEITDDISNDLRQQMVKALGKYGVTLLQKEEGNLIKNIKKAIEEMIFSEEIRTTKVSVYLSEKLDYSYSHLSNLFSEETYTSIENFIILRKIEYVKRLILEGHMSLTEIAHKLDYSSVAHLSGQFKKTTGITPTAFLRIIEKRKINI